MISFVNFVYFENKEGTVLPESVLCFSELVMLLAPYLNKIIFKHHDCVVLMTPGLSKDIQCHVRMTIHFLNLQLTRSDIWPHTKWAISHF